MCQDDLTIGIGVSWVITTLPIGHQLMWHPAAPFGAGTRFNCGASWHITALEHLHCPSFVIVILMTSGGGLCMQPGTCYVDQAGFILASVLRPLLLASEMMMPGLHLPLALG